MIKAIYYCTCTDGKHSIRYWSDLELETHRIVITQDLAKNRTRLIVSLYEEDNE